MSKRAADTTMGNNEKKRKHLTLSIAQKVKLLEKLDQGVSVQRLTEEYGVGTTTVYDLKKQKDQLLKFYTNSENHKLMKHRKTLHRAKNEALDHLLRKWIRQQRSECMQLTGLLIIRQAKIYHKELKIEGECEYSEGWLQKFKKRHGIKYLNASDKKGSAENSSDDDDNDTVKSHTKIPIDELVKICDQLIGGLEQHTFIGEQEILTIYAIKERLLRQKRMLMKQKTLEKVCEKAICHNAAHSLQKVIPGSSLDVKPQAADNSVNTDRPSSPHINTELIFNSKETLILNCQNMGETEEAWIKQEIDFEAVEDGETNIPDHSVKVKQEPGCEERVADDEIKYDYEIVGDVNLSPVEEESTAISLPLTFEENLLYCEECKLKYEGDCPVHRPPIYLDNAEKYIHVTNTILPSANLKKHKLTRK